MNDNITFYKQHLNLHDAIFTRIQHNDAIVAIVYNVTLTSGTQLILKICTQTREYLREAYFLTYFADTLPVPKIIAIIPPEEATYGAILMERLPGQLLTATDFTPAIAYELGSLLARIHLNRTAGYGDLIEPDSLQQDPRAYFTLKFEEGFAECNGHLPEKLMAWCRQYYTANIDQLLTADGPCIIHRDFRPGNIIINNGKLQGIIDWAGSRSGFAQDDFTPMEHYDWQIPPNIKTSFVAGYASIRPLPDYRAMMQLLRLGRAIATIGFTIKRGTWNTDCADLYHINRKFLKSLLSKSI